MPGGCISENKKGSGASRRPGSGRYWGFRPSAPLVRAGIGFASRPGSEGSFKCRLRRYLYSSPPKATIPQPSATQWLSNLRTLRTFGPEGRQPSRPKGRVQSRHHNPRAVRPVKPKNPPAKDRSNFRTLRAQRAHPSEPGPLRGPFYFNRIILSAKARKKGSITPPSIFSGCHCTAQMSSLSLLSTASMMPSRARAASFREGASFLIPSR